MAKKTLKKKKNYQTFCRMQVRNGLVNTQEGNWVKYDSNSRMHTMMRDGYKVR